MAARSADHGSAGEGGEGDGGGGGEAAASTLFSTQEATIILSRTVLTLGVVCGALCGLPTLGGGQRASFRASAPLFFRLDMILGGNSFKTVSSRRLQPLERGIPNHHALFDKISV